MIRLAEIFQDKMILQRQKKLKLWGTSDKAQILTLYLNNEKLVETSVEVGEFILYLPKQEAMENAEIRILGSKGDEITLKEIDFGEVWIAGGQSNMEFLLCYDREGDTTIELANDEHFRFYNVGQYAFEGEKEEGFRDASHWDKWMKYAKEDAAWFSAVGVYFAQKLRAKLQVPVGIVGCNWGGTSASCWMAEEYLENDEKLKVYLEEYNKATKNLNLEQYYKKDYQSRKAKDSEQEQKADYDMMKNESTAAPNSFIVMLDRFFPLRSSLGPHDKHRPNGLYHTMQQKIAGYSCRGVIWYQGESDDKHATLYGRLFSKLIQCWRHDWQEKLPFLFVQLAPFEAWLGESGKNYPILREQQQRVENGIPNVWMASIMDVGSRYDIHPKDKRPVGERLARLALNKIYGQQESCEAPRLQSITKQDGKLMVTFYCGCDRLAKTQDAERLFEVKLEGKKLICCGQIEENTIILSAPQLQQEGKVTVSFAYMPYCVMNIYSEAGLPAKPFAPVDVK